MFRKIQLASDRDLVRFCVVLDLAISFVRGLGDVLLRKKNGPGTSTSQASIVGIAFTQQSDASKSLSFSHQQSEWNVNTCQDRTFKEPSIISACIKK